MSKRCLVVASEFPPGPGGIGTHAWELARHLTRSGWKVQVLTPQDHAGEAEIEAFNSSQPFALERLRRPRRGLVGLLRAVALFKALVRFRPTVVVASGQRMVWLAVALGRIFGRPVVAVGHGAEFGLRKGWSSRITRWAFERAALVICVSRYTRDRLVALGVPASPSHLVIPNGADDDRFRPLGSAQVEEFRRRRGLAGRRLLVTVGQVGPRKGQDTVIRALPQVIEKFPTAAYVMAGIPTLERELVALAQSLDMNDHVRFLGRVDDSDLIALLSAAAVFVMVSRHTADGDFEGFGIAAVEAALCGAPAVVASESGLPEAVAAGVTGLIVPPDDPRATAEAILSLLGDEDRRLRMGAAAQARARSEQTWAHRIAAYDRILCRWTS